MDAKWALHVVSAAAFTQHVDPQFIRPIDDQSQRETSSERARD